MSHRLGQAPRCSWSLFEGGGQAGFRGWTTLSGSLLEIVDFRPYRKYLLWFTKKINFE